MFATIAHDSSGKPAAIKRERAFTLIELLIVIAVVAILAMISVPNFLRAQTRAKLARAQSEMHVLAGALEAYWIDQRAYPPNLVEMVIARPPAPGEADDRAIVWSHRIELADGLWLCETSPSVVLRLGGSRQPSAADSPLPYNGVALIRLTTPVAYLGHLPADAFMRGLRHRRRMFYRPPAVWGPADPTATASWDLDSMRPFGYLNLTEIEPDGLPMPAFGRTVTYVLVSPGPDIQASFTDPTLAFPISYDPTNGTISTGDLVLPGSQ